jgi:hypothetical protein
MEKYLLLFLFICTSSFSQEDTTFTPTIFSSEGAEIENNKGEEIYLSGKNETIKAETLYVNKTTTIRSGVTVKILPGTVVCLRNGARVIIESGGRLEADYTIFNFESPTSSSFVVHGELILSNCSILNTESAVYADYPQRLRITNSSIISNQTAITVYDPRGEVYIADNNFDGQPLMGINIQNANNVTIHRNSIFPKFAGILLMNVNGGYITHNIITGTENFSVGILADRSFMVRSSNGGLYNNTITNCFRGVYLIFSLVDMGRNVIKNNYQYGLYLAQSTAYMCKSNETLSEGLIFDLRGYNSIFNNGNMETGAGDNSEIFIDYSNVVFNRSKGTQIGYKGKNCIIDDRWLVQPDTRYLISGTELVPPGTLDANYSYWGETNNPEERFKNISVNYENFLSSCPPPLLFQRPEFQILADPYGNVLDTIYASEALEYNTSLLQEQLDLATKYISDSMYTEAEALLETIISLNGQELESLEAYNKLLYILNITNASSQDYQNFYNLIVNNKMNASDSLMKFFLEDLGITVLVSSEEFQQAVNLLENKLSLLDPESDAAFYTELEIMFLNLLGNGLGKKKDFISLNEKFNNLLTRKFSTKNNQLEIKISNFALFENYPNPFNPLTTIKYEVPSRSEVSLKVYDVLGNLIASLVNEVKDPGMYEVQFNGYQLASGVYIYQFISKDFILTRKMVLMK